MRVTSVRFDIFSPKERGNCAEATVVFDGELAVHRVCVVRGEKGYFVAMPHISLTRTDNRRKYEDLVHPITSEFRELLSQSVLAEFEKMLKE